MVASTDIKFYVHTNSNAPQLQDAYGSMINVLDACLIDGIQIGVVSSLTASGNTVTATFGAAHNLMQYQVIKITGAAQAEYNGEHRILTVPNAQSVTFELAAAPNTTTATGTITASLPPLGWEKPFSSSNQNGGGKAAYRSLNLLLPSRPFLRVVDELDPAYTATYAKFAKVGIVEDMTDIDTMLGVQAPFDPANPDKNWVASGSGGTVINGWARWYYASNSDWTDTRLFNDVTSGAGIRSYVIVGNADFFYICPASTASSTSRGLYGFGHFEPLGSADLFSNFLLATVRYETATAGYNKATYTNSSARRNGIKLSICHREYNGIQYPTFGMLFTMQTSNSDFMSGSTNYTEQPGATNGVIPLCPVYFCDRIIRGEMPSLKWLQSARPATDRSVAAIDGGAVLFVNQGIGGGVSGQVAFALGEV